MSGFRISGGGLSRLVACLFAAMFFLCTGGFAADFFQVAWPTPNRAFLEGKGIDAFVQPTVSGEARSGLFGGTRSGGRRFHGGLDLKPVKRERSGEAADPIFAAMDGVVRYVNTKTGNSSYGRYIVIEHMGASPRVLTLYAHLAAAYVKAGEEVKLGQVIGKMGRSAGGYSISRDRAHLHFEFGLWLGRDFQSWYVWKKFGSPNYHGVWNGLNMVRIDPLDFFQKYRSGTARSFGEYFANLEEAVRVRIATRKRPDFLERYPEFVVKQPEGFLGAAGWEISLDWTGVPFAWRALEAEDVRGWRVNEYRIVAVNEEILRRERSKSMAVRRKAGWVAGSDLASVMERVFGIR